jgi:GT2 family glycosyltransferase
MERSRNTERPELKAWPKVAIIVLNWNGWQHTIKCLESLQCITYPNYQIIIVDNGSTDDSVIKIKAWISGVISVVSQFRYKPNTKSVQLIEYNRLTAERGGMVEEEIKLKGVPPSHRIILIRTEENLGFAGGNNVAIRYILNNAIHYYEYLCLLNNDLVVDPSFLDFLVVAAEKCSKIGIIGPKVYFYDNKNVIQSMGGKINLWTGRTPRVGLGKPDILAANLVESIDVDHISGCAMLISRQVFETIGLFDEAFFLTFEDTDFCYRAKKAGFRIIVAPKSKVWHKESASTKGAVAAYYSVRNRALFMRKHARFYHWPSFLVFYVLGNVKQLILSVFEFRIGKAKNIIEGMKAGIRLIFNLNSIRSTKKIRP